MGLNGLAPVMIFLIGGLGFKSAVWVSDRWLGFADRWTGLMVCECGSVDGLCLCVALCFWFDVCVWHFVAGLMLVFVFVCVGVVMGLGRMIGVSWVCACCVLNRC